MRSKIAKSSTIISITKLEVSGRSHTIHVAPKTNKILKILLPTTFQIAMSDCFLSEATTEVTNSGALVPKATIVSQIIDAGTQNDAAIFVAEPTKKSAQIHSPISHRSINQRERATDLCSIFSSSTSDFQDFANQNV